jgi:hypothetical protein
LFCGVLRISRVTGSVETLLIAVDLRIRPEI